MDTALFLSPASAQALANCAAGSGGTVSSVVIDSGISALTVGPTVLTAGGLGGTNIPAVDMLSAKVTGGPQCASGSALAAVVKNPAKPGIAQLQLTSMSFTNCTLTLLVDGVQPATVVVTNLPYGVGIEDSAGDPAVIGSMSLTFVFPGGFGSCSYASSPAFTGSYSNASDSLTFNGSSLAFSGGTGAFGSECPTSSLTLPSLIAVVDSSQNGSPAVFVN